MAADVAESTLDKRVRFICRSSLRRLWDDEYGLSEEDVLGAAARASSITTVGRALDIAFEERNKLYAERM